MKNEKLKVNQTKPINCGKKSETGKGLEYDAMKTMKTHDLHKHEQIANTK